MHRGFMVYWNDALWRGRPIVQGAVWSDLDVVLAPLLDDDACFLQRVEDLTIEQLVTHTNIEALDIAVFPRSARFDISRLCPNGPNPISNILGNELGPVVGTNVFWWTA